MNKKFVVVATMMLAMGGTARSQAIDPIETRQTAMDLLSGTFGGVRAVVAANGDVKTLERSGKWIQRFGNLIPTLFPAGSDKGKTKAAPAIWSNAAGFQQASVALASAGDSLATAAKAGDAAAVAVAVKAVGDACGGCHKEFQLK